MVRNSICWIYRKNMPNICHSTTPLRLFLWSHPAKQGKKDTKWNSSSLSIRYSKQHPGNQASSSKEHRFHTQQPTTQRRRRHAMQPRGATLEQQQHHDPTICVYLFYLSHAPPFHPESSSSRWNHLGSNWIHTQQTRKLGPTRKMGPEGWAAGSCMLHTTQQRSHSVSFRLRVKIPFQAQKSFCFRFLSFFPPA